MNMKTDVDILIKKLREQRDDLKVQVRLASMEVRDEWEQLERKWEELVDKSKRLKNEVEPAVENVHTALNLLGSELKDGYKKIKNSLL